MIRADCAGPVDVVAGEDAVVVDDSIDGADGAGGVVDDVEQGHDADLVGHGHPEAADTEGAHGRHRAGGIFGAERDIRVVSSSSAR